VDTSAASPRIATLASALAAGDRASLAEFWQALTERGTPLMEPIPGDPQHSLVTFVWRAAGEGTAPAVVSAMPGKDTTDPMEHLAGTDVWHKTYRVRNDTRESYQFAIGGEHVTDPLNPRQHVFPDDPEVGFKGWVSSVVALPQALPQRWSLTRPDVPVGDISLHRIRSGILGRDYRVWVYTPPGYSPQAGPYGFALVLDGNAYIDAIPAPVVLDNLLADGFIPPLVAVFVSSAYDPTRQRDLACHVPFEQFLTQELLAWVRARYRLTDDPGRSVLIGCSLGGLMAAFVGLHHPDLFGNLLCQSAYFGWRPKAEPEDGWIIRQYRDRPGLPLRFFMDVGRLETEVGTWEPGFNNFPAAARHMRDVLLAKGYAVHYHEFTGAHNPMNWPDTLPLGLMSLLGTPTAQAELRSLRTGYAHPESLASPEWLAAHLDDPNVRLAEVVWGDSADFGRPGYDQSHIPGAVAWDFAQDLQTPGTPGDVVDAAAMQALMSRSGIGPDTTVVVYSGLSNLLATFAFWLLKVYGHRHVRLLDGDKRMWLEKGHPLSSDEPSVSPAAYPLPIPDRHLRASCEDVLASLGQANTLLVDARSAEMYAGQDKAGTARGGHIPGAVNLAARREVHADGSFAAWRVATVKADGTFRPIQELRDLATQLSITPGKDIITYCVRGGLSTHAWFVLTQLLGYPNVREYDRSWAEWGNCDDVPIG
jgi:enterochelin esterase family protein